MNLPPIQVSLALAAVLSAPVGGGSPDHARDPDPAIVSADVTVLSVGGAEALPSRSGTRALGRRTELEDSAYTSANVSLGDLNGDGALDVVLVKGRHWPLHNLVRFGDGKGGLSRPVRVGSEPDRSYSGVVTDMDLDGDPDLVVSNDDPDPKRIYLNRGDGSFFEASTFGRPEWSTRHVAVAELNGDGLPDLVIANRGAREGTDSFVCFGIGDGRVEDPCTPIYHGSATTITPADLDGDGDVDLVVPHRDGGQSLALLNAGDGTFQERTPFGPADAAMRSAKAADVDGDGLVDIVAIHQSVGPVRFAALAGGGYGPMEELPGSTAMPYALKVHDVDGNGRPDVLAGYVEAPSTLLLNDGPDDWTVVPFGDGEGRTYGFALGDVDGDGFTDVAVARSGAKNELWFGAPGGSEELDQPRHTLHQHAWRYGSTDEPGCVGDGLRQRIAETRRVISELRATFSSVSGREVGR